MADVLIVDDDSAIRCVVRAVLEAEGYVVHEARDGLAALEHLQASPCGRVVLLDLEMPRMNGVQTLEALASQPLPAQHAVIIITASTRALPTPFEHVPVLRKPFSLDDLVAHVEGTARRFASLTHTLESTH